MLAELLQDLKAAPLPELSMSTPFEGNYNGWPDNHHLRLLEACGRKLWRFVHFVEAIRS